MDTIWRLGYSEVVWSLLWGFFFSGMDVLQYNDVTFEMMSSAFPESLSRHMEFAQRLKIEGKN